MRNRQNFATATKGFSIGHYSLMIFALLMAAGLQSTFAGHLYVGGGQPDFLLTTATVIGVQTSMTVGTGMGFAAGLLTAGIGGPYAGTYIISRTVACFSSLWLVESFLRQAVLASLLATFCATIFSGILFGFSVPHFGLIRLIQMTGVSALMNTVLALPLAFIFSFLGKQRSSFF